MIWTRFFASLWRGFGLESFGDPNESNIAASFDKLMRKEFSKEDIENFEKNIKVLENLEAFTTPRIQSELYHRLSQKSKEKQSFQSF